MQSKATTVKAYLKDLPADRREALEQVRKVILKNLDPKFEEGMQYGMIGYFVPHAIFPAGYHCDPSQPLPFASVASQKNHMAIHLMCIYSIPAQLEWFLEAWEKSGCKKPDMGKSCIRFKKLDDIPLDVIGKLIKRVTAAKFISNYESVLEAGSKGKPSTSKSTKMPAAKKKKKKTTKVGSKKVQPKKALTKKKTTKKKR